MYRLNKMNQVQGQWTWTITGQYLRALAGVRFSRLGATECDVMFNLMLELATVDSKVFWSNGSVTNILDYGAEHLKLRQIDMPRHFFSGNNCVPEHGHYPANFLLGGGHAWQRCAVSAANAIPARGAIDRRRKPAGYIRERSRRG